MYLIQFKNAPRLRFERASQFYADLIFDFLVGKIKYDSFTQDSGAMINILSETDVLHGPPEIVCKCISVDISVYLKCLYVEV